MKPPSRLRRLRRHLPSLLLLLASAGSQLEAQTYAVDRAASRVRIHLGRSGLMKFLGHDHHIDVPVRDGLVEVTSDDPARSRVVLRFESALLAVVPGSEPAGDIPKVEERMRGEVLEVARYPEITFASTSVRGQGHEGARLRLLVAGRLTLRGRASPVEIPLEVERGPSGIVARGEAHLDLRGLGIEPPSVAGVVKVANRFRLEFEVRASVATVR